MTKTQLIAKAAGLGLEVEDKTTKEKLMEDISNHYIVNDQKEDLVSFLDEVGFTLNDDGEIVKKSKRGTLGENPNTKAFHTIKVLQDESLAELSYNELAKYLKDTEGVETTANSIAWYANWLKTKNKPVVSRMKKKKAAPEEPASEDAPKEPVFEEQPEEV
jgi:hypothetical protein